MQWLVKVWKFHADRLAAIRAEKIPENPSLNQECKTAVPASDPQFVRAPFRRASRIGRSRQPCQFCACVRSLTVRRIRQEQKEQKRSPFQSCYMGHPALSSGCYVVRLSSFQGKKKDNEGNSRCLPKSGSPMPAAALMVPSAMIAVRSWRCANAPATIR